MTSRRSRFRLYEGAFLPDAGVPFSARRGITLVPVSEAMTTNGDVVLEVENLRTEFHLRSGNVGAVSGGELRSGETVAEVENDRRGFREHEALLLVDKRRDDAERVERAVALLSLRLLAADLDEAVVRADLGERRVRSHRSGARPPVEDDAHAGNPIRP